MTDIIDSLLMREPRCQIKNTNDLTVTIARDDAWSESIEAKLLDLSAGGARFRASQAFSVKEVVAARIEVKTPRRTVFAAGEVCWVTPGTDDHWSFGCSFKPPIPDEVLHEFATGGIAERREHPRERISLRTTAKWELSSETATAWVLNHSPGGGFCLLSQSEGMLGERVLLQFQTDDGQELLVRGTARWQLESEEGFVIGCEFLSNHDFVSFSELIHPKPRDDAEAPPGPPKPQMLTDVVSSGELPKPQVVWRRSACILAASSVMLVCTLVLFGTQIPSTKNQRLRSAEMAKSTNSLRNGSSTELDDRSREIDGKQDEAKNATLASPDAPSVGYVEERPVTRSVPEQCIFNKAVIPGVGAEVCTVGAFPVSQPIAEEPASLEPELSEQRVRKPDAEVITPSDDQTPPDPSQPGAPNGRTVDDKNTPVGTSPSIRPRRLESQAEAGGSLSHQPLSLSLPPDVSRKKRAILEWLSWSRRTDNAERASAVRGETDVTHLPGTPPTGQALQPSHSDSVSPTLPAESTCPSHQRAMEAFRQGRVLYNHREFDQAAEALQTAIQYDGANALYVYFLAMAQYQLGRYEQAERGVKEAVELEREQPVPAWGNTMQRYQGRVRVWLENARRRARRT